MVHGLETMKRLNDEAVEKAEGQSRPDVNSDLNRTALGFCLVGMLIVVTVAGTHIGQWLLQPTQTEPIKLSFEAVEAVEAVPLFKFGDRVLFVHGFFRGTSGRVMEWDPEECTYSVATEWRLVEGVSEQDLLRIRDEHPLWPDRELPRPEPVPAPEPTHDPGAIELVPVPSMSSGDKGKV